MLTNKQIQEEAEYSYQDKKFELEFVRDNLSKDKCICENFNAEEKELFFDESEEGRIARDLCHTIAKYYQSKGANKTRNLEEGK